MIEDLYSSFNNTFITLIPGILSSVRWWAMHMPTPHLSAGRQTSTKVCFGEENGPPKKTE